VNFLSASPPVQLPVGKLSPVVLRHVFAMVLVDRGKFSRAPVKIVTGDFFRADPQASSGGRNERFTMIHF